MNLEGRATPSGPTISGPPAANLLVTRFTLSFALVSGAASLLPLFAASWLATPPRGLDRGASLAWYLPTLCVFFGVVATGGLLRAPGKSIRTFAVLFIYAGLFAALPAIVAAYVSGVAAKDLVRAAAAPVLVAGSALLARAVDGSRGVKIFVALFLLFAVAVPGVAIAAHAAGVATPFARLADVSPVTYVWRIATRRAATGAPAWWIAAASVWCALPIVARYGRKAAAVGLTVLAAGFAVPFVDPPAMPVLSVGTARSMPQADARIEAPYGPWTRTGGRTVLRVSVPHGSGRVEWRFRTERRSDPADGAAREFAVVLLSGETDVVLVGPGGERRLPLPVAAAGPDSPLVLVKNVSGGAAARLYAEPPPSWSVAEIPPGFAAAAAEVFDVVVIDAAVYAGLAATERTEYDRFAAFGGALALVDPLAAAGPPDVRPDGEGRRVLVRNIADLDATKLRRRPVDYLDPALRSVFLRPDWARVDLTSLAWFLVLYHTAFLFAFLLPWRLDAHKSSAVYLVSTGFVLVAVVFGGRAVLRSFFLRDNQTATQSFTAATIDCSAAEPRRAVVRQWRSYASMSGERRDLVVGGPLTGVYRVPGEAPFRLAEDAAEVRLVDVELDRFQRNVLVREDRNEPMPLDLTLVRTAAAATARIIPVADTDDRSGFRSAVFDAAWLLDGKGGALPGFRTPDGSFRFEEGRQASAAPPLEVRAAVARSCPPEWAVGGGRARVVVTGRGLRRFDDAEGYFNVEDRGFCLVFVVRDDG